MVKKFIKKYKYLIVGLSLLLSFNNLESKALVTHTLNYTTDPGDTGTLSGSITIDETSVTYGTNINNGNNQLPDWITSLTLNWNPGEGSGTAASFSKSDFMAVRWVAIDSSSVDYSADLVPQFTQISFVDATGNEPGSGPGFEMNYSGQEYQLTSTPGPLPLIGFGFLVGYKRKIKSLLNSSL